MEVKHKIRFISLPIWLYQYTMTNRIDIDLNLVRQGLSGGNVTLNKVTGLYIVNITDVRGIWLDLFTDYFKVTHEFFERVPNREPPLEQFQLTNNSLSNPLAYFCKLESYNKNGSDQVIIEKKSIILLYKYCHMNNDSGTLDVYFGEMPKSIFDE